MANLHNKTKTVTSTKTASGTKTSSSSTTTTTSTTPEPARTKIIASGSNQKKPLKHKKTPTAHTTTTTPEPIEEEDESEDQQDEDENDKNDSDKNENSNGLVLKECEGECMNGILAIFCDDIDSEAFCPNEGSCCITGQAQQSATSPAIKNTPTKAPVKHHPKPSHKPAQKKPAPPPPSPSTSQGGGGGGGNDLFSQILSFAENTLSGGNDQPAPQAPPKIPKCPGFCLLNIMAAFCERPSVLISTPTTCAKGSVCCDNSRAPAQNRQPPPSPPPTQPPYVINTPAPDPREECPGSCIVSLLSFTCFKNAEMTDLFKCKRSGQTCCAPKSKILEKQQFQTRNDTSYAHYPPLPPPPQLGVQQYPPQSAYPPPPPPQAYMPTQPPQMHHHYPPPPPPMQVPQQQQPNYDYSIYGPSIGKFLKINNKLIKLNLKFVSLQYLTNKVYLHHLLHTNNHNICHHHLHQQLHHPLLLPLQQLQPDLMSIPNMYVVLRELFDPVVLLQLLPYLSFLMYVPNMVFTVNRDNLVNLMAFLWVYKNQQNA